ncbi:MULTISPECIES: flagellar assembly protein FliW [unclassified Microbacterium]|uniref:flagellar assembly protein FliW n=1 Tax=unclassified Microbacterium TaxID=2609290 RepID=UPI001DAF5312|nr:MULTISPECIES: flagellar assembly protein FliW [unclassified Microbacterium]CAH0214536.1 Flagellar assembly factor FliW [Microbacterium sp. Bi121]HWK76613.1 flagellar assembly protein FliW [Microbacterium sp.]
MSAVLSFVAPPPGLAPHVDFALTPVDGSDGLFTLRAVDDAELRLYLVDPSTVLTDYAPMLTDEQTDELALSAPEDAMLLVVAHPAADGVSVNLLAPVVVNRGTGVASQVILEGQDYPLRAALS